MTATSIFFLILPLFCLIYNAAGSKDGIIGFGISLYPDLCCQACHDSLSSLHLTCTVFDHGDMSGGGMGDMGDMEMMGTTSNECYVTNAAWLQTMAYCIQQNCNADGYPSEKQAECFSADFPGQFTCYASYSRARGQRYMAQRDRLGEQRYILCHARHSRGVCKIRVLPY
jgi:hypothetical protein